MKIKQKRTSIRRLLLECVQFLFSLLLLRIVLRSFAFMASPFGRATSAKILGIKIDKHLSWFLYFNYLKDNLIRIKFNAYKLISKNCGVINSLQKIWYQNIVKKKEISFASSIWGGGT